MKIVLASSNEHKVREINCIVKELLGDDAKELEFILPPCGFDPIENGSTFEENSLIKARAAWEISKTSVLADDSGLCIDYLDGKPGIYSARYAETPERRIKRVLKEMDGATDRKAYFACCMTLLNQKGEVEFSYTGICNGSITHEPRGNNGFGYDPVFLICGSDKTMAELSDDEKNKISHRSIATRAVINYIKSKYYQ